MGARPGLALYGFSPVKCHYDFKPVMTLKSVVVQIKTIQKDQIVSYGATWKARRETQVAVVGIGYGDGYFRSLSNNSEMLIRGVEVPVVGRVCMDYCMLDITDHPEKNKIHVNEEVIVFGTQLKVDRLAAKIQTIPYELLTHVGARVPRMEVV
jgi:alanine racemase